MAVKVTFGFYATLTGDRRASWSESRWLPGASALDGSADNACKALVNARLALMAGNCFSLNIRQSLFTSQAITGKQIASRQRNRILVPSGSIAGVAGGAANIAAAVPADYQAQGGQVALLASQPKECIQAAVDGQIGGGGRSSTNLYLAGNPDILISTGVGGTLFYAQVPGWIDRFTTYLQTLQAGAWGYPGVTAPPGSGVVPITNWTNETAAPNRLMLTVGSQLAIGAYNLKAGDKVHVRGIRNQIPRTPRAIGLFRIATAPTTDGAGNWTYVLANTSAFQASDIISAGTVESVTQSFFNYLGTGVPLRAATRKRGGSLGSYRGRSPVRPRLLA